jgi:hypothetical protein
MKHDGDQAFKQYLVAAPIARGRVFDRHQDRAGQPGVFFAMAAVAR